MIRFVARFPFDVAADAGRLKFRSWFSSKQGVHRRAQIFSGDGNSVARTAGVKLAAINEAAATIKQEKIRRAGGLITFGDGLRLVVKIRENIAGGFHFLLHFCRAVGGIILCVVGIYANDGDVFRRVVASKLRKSGANVNHVGTVVAHEEDEQRGRGFEIGKRDGFTVRVRQLKIWRGRAERQHG